MVIKKQFPRNIIATVSIIAGLTPAVGFSLGLDSWGRTHESFVNWENPHVHPLDMTPDGSKLLAVNTADNSLMVFNASGTTLKQIATIPVGLDPVSVRALNNNEAWVINHVSDTVSIVDLSAKQVIATLQTDDEPADVVFAGSPQKAFVSASQANTVDVFDISNLQAAPQKLFINGEDPRALAVSPDGKQVYAAIFESGNATTAVTGGKANGQETDLVRRAEGPYGGINVPPNKGTQYVPAINPNNPPPPPVSMIVRKDDSGRWLDDNNGDWSRFISGNTSGIGGAGARVPGWDLPDRDVAVIDTQTLAVSYQKRLMNTLMALAVHPVSGEVTVVGTDATNQIRWEPNLQGTFVRVMLARFKPQGQNQITDLNPHLTYTTRTIPQAQRNLSIGDPRGIAWNAAGTKAYVTGMGSDNVIIINAAGQRLDQVNIGEGPTGIVVQDSSQRAFVLNRFDGSISTLSLANNTETDRLSFFDPTPKPIKIGRRHLYNTHTGSGLGQASCASCHIDGRTDRLAWDLGNPAGNMTILRGLKDLTNEAVNVAQHPMKGPMLTMTLQDIIGHPSMHWSGDKANLGHFSTAFVTLQGADAPLRPQAVNEFEDMLDSIHIPPNPYRNLDNSYSTNVQIPGPNGTISRTGNASLGRDEFEGSCRRCHPGNTARGNRIITNGFGLELFRRPPTWRNFYERSGLWFKDATGSNSGFGIVQDGSFDTPQNGSRTNNMMAFMLSFNGRFPNNSAAGMDEGNQSKDTHAAVGKQLTLTGTSDATNKQRLDTFIALSNKGEVGLVAKGGAENRGYAYIGTDTFQSDRSNEIATLAQLQASASPANPITLTVVPAGSEIRIGIDRDLDSYYDRDELDKGSNPLDQASIPSGTATFCPSPVNVARKGETSQSSTWGNIFLANLAIDGNLGNFTATATGQSPANWQVQLDSNYAISSIVLYNRTSCCQTRLRDISVYILDANDQPVFKTHYLNRHNRNSSPSKIVVDVAAIAGQPIQGNKVKVVRTPDPLLLATNGQGNVDEPDVLSLAEVEVNACALKNLVANAGFEAPAMTKSDWGLFDNAGSLSWQSNSYIELQKAGLYYSGSAATEGSQWLELNADGAGPWEVFQTITTIPGKQYLFSFAYSARPNTGLNSATAQIDGQPVISLSANGSNKIEWKNFSQSFIATGDTTTIRFKSVSGTTVGNLIDNVSVTAIQ